MKSRNMPKGISSVYRMVNMGQSRRCRRSLNLFTTFAIVLSLTVLFLMPYAQSGTPQVPTIARINGSTISTEPDCLEEPGDTGDFTTGYCVYQEVTVSGNRTMLIYFNWTDVWSSELYIGKISLHAFAYDGATPEQENFTLEVYNGTNWNPRMDIRVQSTSSALPFSIGYYILDTNEMADGKVYSRLVDTVPGTYSDHTDINASEVYIDYLALTPYEDKWSDRIDALEKELEELERRINDLDTGYLPYTPNEPHIPYGARDFLDDSDTYLVCPPATYIYEIVDQQGSSNNNEHWLPYPTSATDVDILADRIEWSFVGTQIWINDTTPSIIFSTTDTGYESWDIFANNYTDAGANLTFDMAGDNTVSTRFVTVKIVESFDWSVNTQTQLHSTAISLENDWGLDARQLQIYVASDPDTSIDESTVEIRDTANNILLEAGIHYMVTSSGFLWTVQHFNSSDQVSYTIEYNIYTPASEALEISCRMVGPTIDMRYYNGVKYQYTTCSAYNPNTYDLVNGRVIFDGSGIRGDIDWDGIQIVDPTGKKYSSIYPLTRDKIAVQGVSIDAASTVVFDIYFRTIPTEPDLWRSFQKWGYWLPALALCAAIITSVPLMAKEKFVEGTGIRIDRDRRKMLRRWALSFLFIFVAGTVAWMYAVALS